jgi:DNA mismatch repair protein MSH2
VYSAGYSPALLELCDLITMIDVFASLAHVFYSSAKPYVRPVVTPAGEGRGINIQQLRHPCMELNSENFIPNDAELHFGTSSFQIITGPNMGGKSTFIRSVCCAATAAVVLLLRAAAC